MKADNQIGQDGICALSEALKVNRTLKKLDLTSLQKRPASAQFVCLANKQRKTENWAGARGARVLGEALKTNTTLKTQILNGTQKQGQNKIGAFRKQQHAENEIIEEGACALSEMLKINTTLTKLDLRSAKQHREIAKPWNCMNNKDRSRQQVT